MNNINEQATRSGKQNLVEGSLENSVEDNLKLSGVSRASYEELVEDYRDFLWKKGLKVWDKDDPRILVIRRRLVNPHESHVIHGSHEWNGIKFDDYPLHKARFFNGSFFNGYSK